LISTNSANAEARYHQLDAQDEASITAALSRIRSEIRHPIRGFVSCAAISGESDACSYQASVFRQIIDINVVGSFLMTRAVADEMHRANVQGSVVLIASMSGHVSNRGINTSAYNASKAAVHQLARSLAAEWGHPQNTFPGSTATATNPNPDTAPRKTYPPIRVNTLSPGHIDTPLSEAARMRGLTDEWASQNMLGRISQPEEFRAPVLFLLSDGSSYMTGAVSIRIGVQPQMLINQKGSQSGRRSLCLVVAFHYDVRRRRFCDAHLHWDLPKQCIYHGSCRGVESLSLGPSTGSAVPMSLFKSVVCFEIGKFYGYPGPLGAQYSPVLLMSNVSIHFANDSAATSGVTAPPSSQNLSNPTPLVMSVLMKPG
jgi:NAD(P)-dependent dehydrogenase (short-subunit alcohol dehydrogenase family)